MKVSIPTNHNYYEESSLSEHELQSAFAIKKKSDFKKLKSELFNSVSELTTYNTELEHLKIFGFKAKAKTHQKEEELILKLYSKENSKGEIKYIIQTGLYAGVLYYKGYQFNITTNYGDVFLKRMLNYVQDIYIDNQEADVNKGDDINEFQNILAYLFVQSIEKSAILGFPKVYKELIQHSHKVRGKIDLNAYLKNNIPFTGRITTRYREQVYIQEIMDVLYAACRSLKKKFGSQINNKIKGSYTLLKQEFSGVQPKEETINKAKTHKVLNNPMHSNFKTALSYAEIILKKQSLVLNQVDKSLKTQGYLFDIAELFELYLEKLLRRHFKDWYIHSQEELLVYSDQFYKRRMFPDLILRHKMNDNVIVFDAKFKKMKWRKDDLDRSDFYQIHSYITYYNPNAVIGGLIYPLSSNPNSEISYAKSIFNNPSNQCRFVIDGICVNSSHNMATIIENEEQFLNRIDLLIESVETEKNEMA